MTEQAQWVRVGDADVGIDREGPAFPLFQDVATSSVTPQAGSDRAEPAGMQELFATDGPALLRVDQDAELL